jgi:cytochrome c
MEKGIIFSSFFAQVLLLITSCFLSIAQANELLLKESRCFACHQVENKRIGPSFKSIAAKYRQQSGIRSYLISKVRSGSSGVWGAVPMPANQQVSEEKAGILVDWILKLK